MKKQPIILALCMLMLLSACGVKKPLYIPTDKDLKRIEERKKYREQKNEERRLKGDSDDDDDDDDDDKDDDKGGIFNW